MSQVLDKTFLKEPIVQILESFEIKKQKLPKETKSDKKQKVETKH